MVLWQRLSTFSSKSNCMHKNRKLYNLQSLITGICITDNSICLFLPNIQMPTRSKTKKSKKSKKNEPEKRDQMPYIRMAFEAIIKTRAGVKGSSRAAIANYIKANFDVKAEGAHFNASLRKALKDGIERGVIEEGSSIQRFKITKLGRKEEKESNLSKKYDIEEEEEAERKRKKAAKRAKAKKEATKKKTKTKKKLTERQKAAAKKKKEKERKEAARKKKRERESTSKRRRRTRSSS